MGIVVTGIGAVTPVGIGREATWDSLTEGRNGVDKITLFDPKAYGLQVEIDAEVKDWDPKIHTNWVHAKDLRYQHRSAQFAGYATYEARKQAGLVRFPKSKKPYDVVNLVGTGGGGSDRYEEMTRAVDSRKSILPSQLIQSIYNSVLSSIAKTTEHDQAFPISTACATGADSAAVATRFLLSTNDVVPCEVSYVGGTEAAISATSIKSFDGIRALSTRSDPETASRPFSLGRDGFVMGEGAVVAILESERFARKRGAKPLARMIGWSSICRPGDPTRPSLDDIVETMNRSIRQANISAKDIDLIIAHGTSTPINDLAETNAIKRVFGECAYKIPITAPKSMVGHMMGAGGALNILVAVQSLVTGIVPPTINYIPDPECDLDYVPKFARRVEPRRVMVDAFGFGNQNCCLIFELFEDWRI